MDRPRDVAGRQYIVGARLDAQIAWVIACHWLRVDERKFAVGGKGERLDAAVLQILVREVVVLLVPEGEHVLCHVGGELVIVQVKLVSEL